MLSLMLVMTSAIAVSAAVGTVSSIEPAQGSSVYEIVITVTADTPTGTMTAQLTNQLGNRLYGMDSVTVDDPAGVDGEYTYTFTFRMPKSAVSGPYKVRVGNNVAIDTKEITYTSLTDKNSFYNDLEGKTAEQIEGYFALKADFLPVDITDEEMSAYTGLTQDVKDLVNAQFASVAIDWSTGYTTEQITPATEAAVESAVNAKATDFVANFREWLEIAKIADVEKEGWTDVAQASIDSADADTFDSYFYKSATAGENLVITVAEVKAEYEAEVANVTTLEKDDYLDTFDKATLMYYAKNGDAEALKTAFTYFMDKGLYTLTADETTAIENAEGNDSFWSALKGEANTDYNTLINNAKTLAPDYASGTTGGTGTEDGGTDITDTVTPGPSIGVTGVGGYTPPKEDNNKEDNNTETTTSSFKDVANVSWAKEAIETLADKGVLSGRGNGEFAPNDSVTREEFVKIIVVAFGLEDNEATSEFADVSADSWSYPYISSANKLGIVTGADTAFNPTHKMSREDMAVVIHRVLKLANIEVNGTKVDFNDDSSIASYAKDAVSELSSAGIINGMGDGTFAPRANVTRAQAAKVVYELLNLIGGEA